MNENNNDSKNQDDELLDYDFSQSENNPSGGQLPKMEDSQDQPIEFNPQETTYQQEKPKKKNVLPIVLTAVIILAALTAIVTVAFGKTIAKMVSPQMYLKTALENTAKSMRKDSLGLPDLSKYTNKPVEQKISFGLDYIDEDTFGYGGSSAEGSYIDMSFKMDSAVKKLLANLSVNAAGVEFNDNEVYVSDDLIALAIPKVYSEHKYITFNPKTLVEDWNSSEFGAYSEISQDINVQDFIDILFGDFKSLSGELNISNYRSDLERLNDLLIKEAKFKNEGKAEVSLGDEKVKLDKMSFTVNTKSLEEFYNELADFYEALISDYYESTGNVNYQAQYAFDNITESLRLIKFTEDLTVSFYINDKQLVSKIDTNEFGISIYDEDYGETEVAKIRFYADIFGKENVLDNIKSEISINADGTTVAMELNRVAADDNNIVDDDVSLNFKAGGQSIMTLNYKLNWDKKSNENDNMMITISADSAFLEGSPSIKVSGKLADNGKEISLSDAALSVNSGVKEVLALNLGYGIKEAKSDDITINKDDSVNFFDFSQTDLFGIISSLQ